MAAALLTDEPITLRRIPALADITNMARLLRLEFGSCIRDRTPRTPFLCPLRRAATERGSNFFRDILAERQVAVARQNLVRRSNPGAAATLAPQQPWLTGHRPDSLSITRTMLTLPLVARLHRTAKYLLYKCFLK